MKFSVETFLVENLFFSPWLVGGLSVLDVDEHVGEVDRPNRSQDGSWLVFVVELIRQNSLWWN